VSGVNFSPRGPGTAARIAAATGKSTAVGLSSRAMLAIQIGSAFAASALTQRKAKSAAAQSFGTEIFLSGDPNDVRQIIYGRAWTGGTLRYRNVHEPVLFPDQLLMVIVLAGHSCEAAEAVKADHETLTLDGSGNVTSPAKWAGKINVRYYLGSDSQTADSTLDATFANWTSDHRLRGCTYAIVRLSYDETDLNTPPSFRFLVKGRKVYDPRLDTTNGGSGSHRLNDETTWEWSQNAVLCHNDFWRGVMINGIRIAGPGVASTRFSWANVIAEANVCDENVTLAAGGNQDRYTANGIIDPRQKHGAVKEMFEQAIGGDIAVSDGKWRYFCGAFRSPSLALLPEHFVGPLRLNVHKSENDRRDTAHGRFASLADDGSAVEYAPISLATVVVGSERVTTVDMQLVNDETNTGGVYDGGARAQRIAKLLLERDAAGKLLTCTTNLYGARAMPGECISLTHAAFGLSSQAMRVMDWRPRVVSQDNGAAVVVDLTLMAGPSSLYSWTTEETALGASPDLPAGTPQIPAGLTVGVSADFVQWIQAPDGGAYSPAPPTSDVTFTFRRPGSTVATHVIRVTRSGATLSAVTESETGDATAETIVGGGTPVVTLIVEHVENGLSAAQAVSVVQGGSGGSPGSPGADGLSVHVSNVYIRSASAPSTPTGGSYDFTTGTLTPPSSWSASPPAGSDPLYVSVGTWAIVGTTGTDSSTTWTTPALFVQDGVDGDDGAPGADGDDGAPGTPGADGDDGLSVYVANVYRRSASAPSTPTGGSYNFTTSTLTPPSSWFATPPAGTDPLYVSVASFSIVGQTGTDSSTTWSAPAVLVQDGADGAPGTDGDDGADGLDAGNWVYTGAFSSTDLNTVAWASGTLRDTSGNSYSITGSNTGDMGGPTYIYWDPAVSTTAFQVTTTGTSAVGGGKILIATAKPATSPGIASFHLFSGSPGSLLISADQLAATLAIVQDLVLATGGKLRGVKTSASDTTKGLYLGDDGTGGPDFHIGDASTYFWFDYSAGTIKFRGNLDFATQTFTPTWSGFSSPPTGDISYIDFGSFVLMFVAGAAGTSNSTQMSFSGVPTAIQPSASGRQVPCVLLDNSAGFIGFANVSNVSNVVSFYIDQPFLLTGFTNSGVKGLGSGWTIIYSK